MNSRFQNALRRIPQPVPPIWMMRQAGRYHSHYQALRRRHSFMDLCKDAKLAAEVALGPMQEFDFDVSILFSDLLFPLEALGMGLTYENGPPELGWHLTAERMGDLLPLEQALQGLRFQGEAVRETRRRLPADKSLIGFVGGPFTLFVYAVEGSHKGSLIKSKKDPQLFKDFAAHLVPLLEKNIEIQLQAGAEVVMVMDTAAGELAPGLYHDLVLPLMRPLFAAFPGRLGYYAKGTTADHWNHSFFSEPQLVAGIGLDHRFFLADVLTQRKSGMVQGNFDQCLLHQSPTQFKASLLDFLRPIKALSPEQRAGWVCGLGHGILPETPEANVKSFVQIVRELFHE